MQLDDELWSIQITSFFDNFWLYNGKWEGTEVLLGQPSLKKYRFILSKTYIFIFFENWFMSKLVRGSGEEVEN